MNVLKITSDNRLKFSPCKIFDAFAAAFALFLLQQRRRTFLLTSCIYIRALRHVESLQNCKYCL